MSPYSIPPLIGSFSALVIGIIVFSKDIQSKVNRVFSIFCLSLAVWLFFFALSYSGKSHQSAYFWAKAGCIVVDFAGPLFYHFVTAFLRLKKEMKFVYMSYALAGILCILSIFTTYMFMPESRKFYYGYYPSAGPFHILAVTLHSVIMIRIVMLLYYSLTKKPYDVNTRYYTQTKYIFWGTWFLVFPSLTDYLPKYGVEIYPFGWSFIIIFCAIVGYAIVKHQLMNINIVIRGALVYSLLVGLMTAVFVVLVLLLERFFQGFTGYRSLFASAMTAFIIAISFNPAKNSIQNFIDRYFFRHTAEEMAHENIRLREELLKQDRMKAVATLAASMAHEIKNPLTVIKTFTEYLPERHDDQDFIDKFTHLVKPQVEKIDFTVQQLLDFSKPSAPNLKPVNMCKILNETLELLSGDFLKDKIKAQVNFTYNNTAVLADSNQLKQVFLNLFLNSIDAMPRGGELNITGKIIKTTGVMKSSNSYGDEAVEINIKDTGLGISKENLNRIFQPFFTTKTNGTGLGLSVVHDILEQHGASIRAESEEGKGMAFIIKFPLVKKA